jgi:hypothetical protein
MLASFIAALALAIGITHAHVAPPAHAAGTHVSAFDGNGGGPPGRP